MSHDGQYCKTQHKNFVGELTQKLVIGTVGSQTEVMTGVTICNTNFSESATKQSPCTELILVECVLFMFYQR